MGRAIRGGSGGNRRGLRPTLDRDQCQENELSKYKSRRRMASRTRGRRQVEWLNRGRDKLKMGKVKDGKSQRWEEGKMGRVKGGKSESWEEEKIERKSKMERRKNGMSEQ